MGVFGENVVLGWLCLNFKCKKVIQEQNIGLSRIAGNGEIYGTLKWPYLIPQNMLAWVIFMCQSDLEKNV